MMEKASCARSALAARARAASASDDQLALIRATEAVLFDECGFRGVEPRR